MSIDADLHRSVLGRFATGVTIVTVRDADGNPHGMTVSAFASVSLEPPLVLVCIDNTATMAALFPSTEDFAVSVLNEDQEELSRRFSGPLDDRFSGVGYSVGESGCAILHGVLAWMECRIVDRHMTGDHLVVVGEVMRAEALEGRPLLYYRGGYSQFGH